MAAANFNNNPIDATGIVGGVLSWQLGGGPLIDPPNVVTKPISLNNVKKIICYTNSQSGVKAEITTYAIQGSASVDYDNNEKIKWTGPQGGLITLAGDNGEVSNWKADAK